jgi:hypothetical protein
MEPDLLASLLGSIEMNRLVIFCGAGLSLAAPSTVPTATALAAKCATELDSLALPIDCENEFGGTV